MSICDISTIESFLLREINIIQLFLICWKNIIIQIVMLAVLLNTTQVMTFRLITQNSNFQIHLASPIFAWREWRLFWDDVMLGCPGEHCDLIDLCGVLSACLGTQAGAETHMRALCSGARPNLTAHVRQVWPLCNLEDWRPHWAPTFPTVSGAWRSGSRPLDKRTRKSFLAG